MTATKCFFSFFPDLTVTTDKRGGLVHMNTENRNDVIKNMQSPSKVQDVVHISNTPFGLRKPVCIKVEPRDDSALDVDIDWHDDDIEDGASQTQSVTDDHSYHGSLLTDTPNTEQTVRLEPGEVVMNESRKSDGTQNTAIPPQVGGFEFQCVFLNGKKNICVNFKELIFFNVLHTLTFHATASLEANEAFGLALVFSSPEHFVRYCDHSRPSCTVRYSVMRKRFCLNIFSSETAHWIRPNFTEMIPGWPLTKVVQIVPVGCISRSQGQKIGFQNNILKNLLV